MFAYGQLSDLKDGTLVTPIRKNGNLQIECRLKDGTLANFSFEDFDFDKTVAEREIINVEIDNDKKEEEVIKEKLEIEISDTRYNFTIHPYTFFMKEKREPDFYWIKERNKLIFSEKVK